MSSNAHIQQSLSSEAALTPTLSGDAEGDEEETEANDNAKFLLSR